MRRQGNRTLSRSLGELCELVVAPVRTFSFFLDASWRSVLLDEADGEPSEEVEIVGPIILANTALVFIERHVQHPVLGVAASCSKCSRTAVCSLGWFSLTAKT